MPVTVKFRGVMLFHRTLKERPILSDPTLRINVLIPNCRSRKLHDDGTPATPHYAWLRIVRPGQVPEDRELTSTKMRFEWEGDHSRVDVDDSLLIKMEEFISVDRDEEHNIVLMSCDPHVNPEILSADIVLTGGTFGGTKTDQQTMKEKWRFNDTLRPGSNYKRDNPAVEVTWTVPNANVIAVVHDAGGERRIALSEEFEIIIGNLDEETPSKWDMRSKSCRSPAIIIDEDFKWLYRLFKPAKAGAKWDNVLRHPEHHTPQRLPVPSVRCPQARAEEVEGTAVGTSTCYGGLFP